MRKILFITLLTAALAISGCGAANDTGPVAAEAPSASAEPAEASKAPIELAPEAPEEPELPAPETTNPDGGSATVTDPFEGITKDEYPGIEITANVLIRRAILPGSAIPVTVEIKNTGDKTVAYVLGSGAYETPEAVIMQIDGLQQVVPKDHMGMVTMDFVTLELKPGEELRYVLTVMAIEPNEQFNKYSHDLYFDGEKYIADIDWTQLKEMYPDLTEAKPGGYNGKVSFRYTLLDEAGQMNPFGNPTGYAQTDLTITVDG